MLKKLKKRKKIPDLPFPLGWLFVKYSLVVLAALHTRVDSDVEEYQ